MTNSNILKQKVPESIKMINERTISSSNEHEKTAETSIGRTEMRISRRNGDLALEIAGGDGAGYDIYRDMCVAKLEENILESEERGNDVQAQADRDVMDFLISLSPDVAKSEDTSLIGLAYKKLEKINDLLSTDSIDADTKDSLEYKAMVASNGINMMKAISSSVLNTWLNSRDAGNEDQQISQEARLKSALMHQHNERIQRNAQRRAASNESDSTIVEVGLSDEAVLTAKQQLENMSRSKRESTDKTKDTQPESRVSSDWKERHNFANEFFGDDMDDHPLARSDENKAILKDYLLEEVKMWARKARDAQEKHGPSMRYAGSISGVMGIQIGVAKSGPLRFAFDIVRFNENDPAMSYDAFQSMKFKDFAKTYLDLDIAESIPDYDKLFN